MSEITKEELAERTLRFTHPGCYRTIDSLRQRIAKLETALREVAADDDPRYGCAHSDSAKRALVKEEP